MWDVTRASAYVHTPSSSERTRLVRRKFIDQLLSLAVCVYVYVLALLPHLLTSILFSSSLPLQFFHRHPYLFPFFNIPYLVFNFFLSNSFLSSFLRFSLLQYFLSLSRTINPLRSLASGGNVGDGYHGASDAARHFEVGMNEATYSLAWLPNQPRCLLAGMGSKFLRLYDIRGGRGGGGSWCTYGTAQQKVTGSTPQWFVAKLGSAAQCSVEVLQ